MGFHDELLQELIEKEYVNKPGSMSGFRKEGIKVIPYMTQLFNFIVIFISYKVLAYKK